MLFRSLELIMLAATLTFLYQNIEKMVSPIVMYTQPETHQLHARDQRWAEESNARSLIENALIELEFRAIKAHLHDMQNLAATQRVESKSVAVIH